MIVKVLTFLQNGRAYYPGGAAQMEADYDFWIWALSRCFTGQRLRRILGPDCFDRAMSPRPVHILYANTTPTFAVGESSGRVPPDVEYCRGVLAKWRPHVVLACGKQAEGVIPGLWPGHLLVLPHPAHRFVTNALLEEAARLVDVMVARVRGLTPASWLAGSPDSLVVRVALRQRKGYTLTEEITHANDA